MELTAEEFLDTLTGFDEIAITKAFGVSMQSLVDDGGSMLGRALVFVAGRRDGKSDVDAYAAAMNLTLAAVNSFFPEPSGDSGKDETPSEQQPTD